MWLVLKRPRCRQRILPNGDNKLRTRVRCGLWHGHMGDHMTFEQVRDQMIEAIQELHTDVRRATAMQIATRAYRQRMIERR